MDGDAYQFGAACDGDGDRNMILRLLRKALFSTTCLLFHDGAAFLRCDDQPRAAVTENPFPYFSLLQAYLVLL